MGTESPRRVLLVGSYIALVLVASTGVALQTYFMRVQNPSLWADLCQAQESEEPPEHSPLCGFQVAPGLPFVEEPAPPVPLPGFEAGLSACLGHPQFLSKALAPRAPPMPRRLVLKGFGPWATGGVPMALRVTLFTRELGLYALVAGALTEYGIEVLWGQGDGLPLADLEHMEKGQVILWRTSGGVRAWDARQGVFLTRKDAPRSLAGALLLGRVGLALRPGERDLWEAMGRLGSLRSAHLVQATGMAGPQVRLHLRGLRNKFGLCDLNLLRLARHSLRVAESERGGSR